MAPTCNCVFIVCVDVSNMIYIFQALFVDKSKKVEAHEMTHFRHLLHHPMLHNWTIIVTILPR